MLGHVKGWYLPQLSPKLTAKLWHPAHSTGERSGTAPDRRTYWPFLYYRRIMRLDV